MERRRGEGSGSGVAYSAPPATSSSPSRISSRPFAAHCPGIYTPDPKARKTSRPAPTRDTSSIVHLSARLFPASHVPGNPCVPHNPGGWAQSRPPAAPARRAGCRGPGRPRRRAARVSFFGSRADFVVVLWVRFAAGTGRSVPMSQVSSTNMQDGVVAVFPGNRSCGRGSGSTPR